MSRLTLLRWVVKYDLAKTTMEQEECKELARENLSIEEYTKFLNEIERDTI